MRHRQHIVGSIVLVSNWAEQYPLRITAVEPQVEGVRQHQRDSQYDLFRDRSTRVEDVEERHIIEILRFP